MLEKVEKWIRRYETIEAACGNARCIPCTYPNCQRFVRERKAVRKALYA